MLTSLEPKELDHREVEKLRQKSVSWKETTVPKVSMYADHTLKTKHTVGQVVHNVHKIYRVLEKSNYLSRALRHLGQDGQLSGAGLQTKLEIGCPQTYHSILKYLVFESSNAFIGYL